MESLRSRTDRLLQTVADDNSVQTYRALYAEQFGMLVHLATRSQQTTASQQMLEHVVMNGLKQLETRILTILLQTPRRGRGDVQDLDISDSGRLNADGCRGRGSGDDIDAQDLDIRDGGGVNVNGNTHRNNLTDHYGVRVNADGRRGKGDGAMNTEHHRNMQRDDITDGVGSRVNLLQTKLLYCEDYLMQRFRDELYVEDKIPETGGLENLAAALTPVVSEARRSEVLRAALEEHKDDLIDVLDPDNSDILDVLARDKLLTESDEDDVRSGSTRSERSRRVLQMMSTSEPSKTEACLLSFLKTHHPDQNTRLQRSLASLQHSPLSTLCPACAVKAEVDITRLARTMYKRRALQRGQYLALTDPSLTRNRKWELVEEDDLEEAVICALVPKFQHYYARFGGVKTLDCRCDEISEAPSSGRASLSEHWDVFKDDTASSTDRLSGQGSGCGQFMDDKYGEYHHTYSSYHHLERVRGSSISKQTQYEQRDYEDLRTQLSSLNSKVNSLLQNRYENTSQNSHTPDTQYPSGQYVTVTHHEPSQPAKSIPKCTYLSTENLADVKGRESSQNNWCQTWI